MSDRGFSVFYMDSHFFTVDGVTANVSFYCKTVFLKISLGNGPVTSRNAVNSQLLCQGAVGRVIFADYQSSRSILIDPMDNSRTKDSIDA